MSGLECLSLMLLFVSIPVKVAFLESFEVPVVVGDGHLNLCIRMDDSLGVVPLIVGHHDVGHSLLLRMLLRRDVRVLEAR